jgi:hypothetical protein
MSTEINLDALVSEVQKELTKHLKAEAEALSKAHPGEDISSEIPADESATSDGSPSDAEEGSEAAPPADSGDSSPAEETPGEAPVDASASDAPPPADDGSAPADPAMDPASDHDALVGEYTKLPIETLKAHVLASKEALMAAMGAGAVDDGSAGAAPPAPPAAMGPPAPAASASPDAPPAMKGEMAANKANGENVLTSVSKSEKDVEIETLRKRVEEQDATMAQVLKAVTMVVEAPVRKSVASIADLGKSAGAVDPSALTKDQVRNRLRERVVERKLSKSDRELVIAFDLGHIGVEKVAHLLSETK